MSVDDQNREDLNSRDLNARDNQRDVASLIDSLSDEKLELLRLLMEENGGNLSNSIILPQKRKLSPDRSGYLMPLSFAQRRLWFLDQFEPGSSIYNIPSAVRLIGELGYDVFTKCVHEIIKRHETLRTRFIEQDGQPFQLIIPAEQYDEKPIDIPLIDMRSLPLELREKEIFEQITCDARLPFDLSKGPLIRVILFKLTQTEHIAYINIHHILADLWSVGVMLQEIGYLYTAFSAGQQPLLPKLPIQYADFAVWQNNYLQGKSLENLLDYWKNRLAGSAPVLLLPTDRPRPAIYSTNGGSINFAIPNPLYQQLQRFIHKEGVTSFMALLTIFNILIYRYSGQDDFCVGSPIANRTRAEVENLIGFFINTLVMRAELSGDPTFKELLKRVKETTLEAYSHQDLPFELLVEKLDPERNTNHSPIFQIMFATQNTQRHPTQLPGLKINSIPTSRESSKYDLTLLMIDDGVSLSGAVEYNCDLFDRRTIERMMQHFQNILETVLDDPDRKLSRISMLAHEERVLLLDTWNKTDREFPDDHCIHELFENQARENPDYPALFYHGLKNEVFSSLSYGELNQAANQLANLLKYKDVASNVLVGVYTQRSVDTIIALLGIMKADGVYLPLDPNYPFERIKQVITDSAVSIVIIPTDPSESIEIENSFREINQEIQIIHWSYDSNSRGNSAAELTTGKPTNCLQNQARSENLAYVIYTSGSTGKPKGAMLSHKGLCNLVTWQKETFEITPNSRVLQFAPFSFDASIWEIFMALANGASLHLASQEILSNGYELINLIKKQAISVVTLPPSVLTVIPPEFSTLQALPELRVVIAAGEPCTREIVKNWAEGRNFFNAYGPTETTVCASAGLCDLRELRDPSIGRPIANTHLYVLDRDQMLVPPGVPGELYIAGTGVAKGYLNRPELSAEKFIPCIEHPLHNQLVEVDLQDRISETLYRTGDLVKYRRDGSLEFLGRIDYQIKLRGYRIELGEIESVIRNFSSVENRQFQETAVVVQAKNQQHKRLIAFASPVLKEVQINDVYEFLQGRLPEYMIPVAIIQLDQMPLTLSGKIDRQKLESYPITASAQLAQRSRTVLARSPEEEILAGLYSEILGLSPIGVYDNFFDLGGHSLLATQLTSRIRKVFQVDIPLQAIFEFPVVEDLCTLIRQLRQKEIHYDPVDIPRLPRNESGIPIEQPPLSFAQQRLWFLEQFEPGLPTYNIPIAIRIDGSLDVNALEESLNAIILRHEVLRTSIVTIEGKPSQVITKRLKIKLEVDDLSGFEKEERNNKALHLATDEVRRPFELDRPPLMRIRLLRLGEAEFILLLTMHHIISDGWSISVLLHEFMQLYPFISSGSKPDGSTLPELTIQYADFSIWQREWLSGDQYHRLASYWKNKLKNADMVLDLPTDYPRFGVREKRSGQIDFRLDKDLSKKIVNLSRTLGVTPFMILLAGFQLLLSKASGQKSISIGTPIANRNHEQIENLIGFFVNTLVIHTDIDYQQTFEDYMAVVRENALGAYSHQDMPFELLVKEVASDFDQEDEATTQNDHDRYSMINRYRDPRYSPLFQVMFVYQNVPTKTIKLPGLWFEPFELGTGVPRYDLTLSMAEGSDGFQGMLEFDTSLFKTVTIQTMIGEFQVILDTFASDPLMIINEGIGSKNLKESITTNRLRGYERSESPIDERVLLTKRQRTYRPPKTPDEVRMVEIWRRVLGQENIGLDDNFFELGGDSVLGIQVTALANQIGLHVSPRMLFEANSLEQLVRMTENISAQIAEQEEIIGLVPLTPIQRWFFELNNINHTSWIQTLSLKVQIPLDRESLEYAIRGLLSHHDALRSRFRVEEGKWKQEIVSVEEAIQQGLLEWIDLEGLSEEEHLSEISVSMIKAQSGLNIEQGPLIRLIYCSLGPGKPNRLMILAHHLVTDGISLAIIVQDFLSLYLQASSKQELEPHYDIAGRILLPAKTTSYKKWSEILHDLAYSRDIVSELNYWVNIVDQSTTVITADFNGKNENLLERLEKAEPDFIQSVLSVEETQILLHDVIPLLRGEANHLFLAALARAFARWSIWRGVDVESQKSEHLGNEVTTSQEYRLRVALEGHGRYDVAPNIDISRTVGWFTNLFPISISSRVGEDPITTFVQTRETLLHVPQHGIGFGLLTYINGEIGDLLSSFPRPAVSFNYFGQIANQVSSSWSLLAEDRAQEIQKNLGIEYDTEIDTSAIVKPNSLAFMIEINAAIQAGRLGIRWSYDTGVFWRDTIQQFADIYLLELKDMINTLISAGDLDYQVSDFPLAGISQSKLDKILNKMDKARSSHQNFNE